jgi:anthranilate phosphoribosyltransferase
VIEVADGRTAEWFVEPGQLGLAPADLDSVAGGTPEENAAVTRAVLAGESGPHRDLVVLNAAAAIYLGGLGADLEQGAARASEAIDSGAAADVLERLIAATAVPAL